MKIISAVFAGLAIREEFGKQYGIEQNLLILIGRQTQV
jgi:hypothetical protein